MTTEEILTELQTQYTADGETMPFDEWLVEHYEIKLFELEARIEELEGDSQS